MRMPQEKLTARQLLNECALLCWAGFVFGIAFGVGAWLGWTLIRGIVRILGA